MPEIPGSKKNPIPIKDRTEARANLSYVIEPVKKEKAHGQAVSAE